MSSSVEHPSPPAAESSPSRYRWLSPVLYLVALGALAAVLMRFAADPVTWDEILYMGVAFDPYEAPHILNRYFHIYLLKACMSLAGDPFVGARLLWALSAAGVLLALYALSGAVSPAARVLVVPATLLLMLGQRVLAWSPGLAYVDHTATLIATVSAALLGCSVLRGREVPLLHAVLLGVLFYLGLKTKETALFLGVLPVLFFVQVDGSGLRFGPAAWARALLYGLGVAVGAGLICLLDGWQLGDPWFSLRSENWRALREFNSGTGRSGEYSWLTWMTAPQNYAAFALYCGGLLLHAGRGRHLREVLFFLMPIGLLLLLSALTLVSNTPVSARYTMPIVPLMCCFGPLLVVRLLARDFDGRNAPLALGIGAALVLACLTLMIVRPNLPALLRPDPTYLRDTLVPLTVFGGIVAATLGVAGGRWMRRPLLLLCLAGLCLAAVPSAIRVVDSLGRRDLVRRGAERFADLREMLGSADLERGARVLLDEDLYDRQFWERGPRLYKPLVQMYAGVRIPWAQIELRAGPAGLSAADLGGFDLLILTPASGEAVATVLGEGAAVERGPRGEIVCLRPRRAGS